MANKWIPPSEDHLAYLAKMAVQSRFTVWARPDYAETDCQRTCYLETNDIADAVAKCEELSDSHDGITIEYRHAA